MEYAEFVKQKSFKSVAAGFECRVDGYGAFDYQQDIVRWSCRRGKAAIFADTGLGKTLMQLMWADQVAQHTGQPVIVFAPLAVSEQTIKEGKKFGVEVERYPFSSVSGPKIYITNYEQIHNVDSEQFSGVVLDESSILKGIDSKTRKQVQEKFRGTPYRLSCTATPSPNDFMELGTQCEFLGIMSQIEMLAMFFIHDGSDTSKWRLKGHGRKKFFEWLATWAIFITKPSDLGYDDTGRDLPELIFHEHIIESGITDGLFAPIAAGLLDRNKARRDTVDARVAEAAMLANGIDSDVIVWCHLNDESAKLSLAVDDAIEVRGSDDNEHKVNAVKWFLGYDGFVVTSKKKVHDECRAKNTLKNTTKGTEKEKLPMPRNGSSKTKITEGSIWKNTEKQTLKNGSEAQINKKRLTSEEGSDTQIASQQELQREKNQKSGKRQIQNHVLISDSSNTESQQTTTGQFLQDKMEDVQYAESITQDVQSSRDCTSITAMQQERLEGCFAQTAISPSESLKTPQSFCEEPRNTSRKVLISKPSMFGYGLNLQNCNQMIFVGLSDSWEQFYQAVRRCWRYGQTRPVHVHIVSADIEGGVLANIKRKEAQHKQLTAEMIAVMKDKTLLELGKSKQEKSEYKNTLRMEIPKWAM